jgi:hypothetical protein
MSNMKNTNNLMSHIAASANLEEAYAWLRDKRQKTHHNNLFWSISQQWPVHKQLIRRVGSIWPPIPISAILCSCSLFDLAAFFGDRRNPH